METSAATVNTTYGFYVKAIKDNRWSIQSSLIVVTDLFELLEEKFIPNFSVTSSSINPSETMTILLKNPPKKGEFYWGMILYDYRVITAI